MKKAVIGTELHLSTRFSRIWINCLSAFPELTEKYDFVVFDNNEKDDTSEAAFARQAANKGFLKFYRNPPNSRLHNTVDAIATLARAGGYEFYAHLDIDCPPCFPASIDELFNELDRRGVACVTDRDGAHFVAFKTRICSWMPAGYHPVYESMKETRFKKVAMSSPKVDARHWFDECRWIFHDLEEQGYEVKTIEWPLLHPTGTSFNISGSRRWSQVVGRQDEYYRMKQQHELFFAHPLIRQIETHE